MLGSCFGKLAAIFGSDGFFVVVVFSVLLRIRLLGGQYFCEYDFGGHPLGVGGGGGQKERKRFGS